MKLGLYPPLSAPIATPEYLTALAQAAERLGFNSIWAPEHVVLFAEHEGSRYPYSADGQIGVPPNAGILDPFEVLTFIAAVTKTIRVGTGIALVAQRNPVYTAKAAASLDWLSNGRFDFGIGLGWLKQEFDAVQVPWARRAQRTAEYVEVMKRLWTDQETSFEGEFYSLDRVWQYPKPLQQPHPPLYFGGESDAALKRAAKLGNGWFGYFQDVLSARERLSRLEELLAEQGRSRKDVRIIITPKGHRVSPEIIEQFAELGVDELVFAAGARHIEDAIGRLETMAEQLLPVAARA